MPKTPRRWKKNPAAHANERTYNEPGQTYNEVGLNYNGVVSGEPISTLKKPRTWYRDVVYTYRHLTDLDRVEAYLDDELVATFTHGSRTAHIRRASRTFTEQKSPFIDLFDRVNTNSWGPSPGGGIWGDFNGSASNYNVNGVGTIACPTTGVSRYVRLNDIVGEFDARVAFSSSSVPSGNTNSYTFICGWQSTSNHVRMRITLNTTGSLTATIAVVVDAAETVLASAGTIGTGFAAGQVWHIRGTFDGVATYGMYAWKDGDTEPTTPTITATDTTFPTGKLGLRVLAGAGATNNPTFTTYSFEGSGQWPNPPVVEHDTWVRLLPEPFNGRVDDAWLTAALEDDTDDVLAIAMQYIQGAPPVMEGPLQISGDAGYGPPYNIGRSFELSHPDDGTRQEGSDWNDYLGINGSLLYTHLAVPKSDNPESHQLHCLDCSGLVRMVYGYRSGLPLCLDDAEDFDGLNLPRRSVSQVDYGPGVFVFRTMTTAPTSDQLAKLMPGDLVFFDADTSNPEEEEGQIDHTGIYLGADADGDMRFVSARKTANGPTFGDLGGPSVINQSGLYVRSLRGARRF